MLEYDEKSTSNYNDKLLFALIWQLSCNTLL